MKPHSYILILFFYLTVSSCSMIGEDAVMVPSYISVQSYRFQTDSNTQGYNSEGFNDMWISNEGVLLGTIGLPALIPIQKVGSTQIRIDAGISITGQTGLRTPYPFMATHTEVRNLEAGVIDTFVPVFRYLSNTDFKFIEDFDRTSRAFKVNPAYYLAGDTVTVVNDGRAWRIGNNSGKVEIATGHQKLQLISGEYDLIGQGSPVYLEIDYRSNLTLDIGYYFDNSIDGTSDAKSVIQTYPTEKWKKLYIELTNEVATRRVGSKYIIYIGIQNLENVVPDVYIDNVKLIGFKG